MSKLRVSLLGLVAMCLASMFMTAAASAAGPFWHTNGRKLVQGSVGVSGQSKGVLTLKSVIARTNVTISCTASHSVGTIDGQGGTLQGQGKGKVKYESCTLAEPSGTTCEVGEGTPANGILETGQLKIHLATATVQAREQIVALFEPAPSQQTTERLFARIRIVGAGCIFIGVFRVLGSTVAQLAPQEAESQEGSLYFPEVAITTITHEGQTVHPALLLETAAATFAGYYGQRAQTGTFGVFRT